MSGGPDLVLGVDGGGTKTVLAAAGRSGALALFRFGPNLDPLAIRHGLSASKYC